MVCIDVDGTLVGSSGSPSGEVLATIAESISKDQKLVLSTARGAMGPTYEYAKILNPSGWHIFHAGAALVNAEDGETREHPIPDYILETCIEIATERDWALELYWRSNYRAFRNSYFTRHHAEMLGIDLQIGDQLTLKEILSVSSLLFQKLLLLMSKKPWTVQVRSDQLLLLLCRGFALFLSPSWASRKEKQSRKSLQC